LIFPQGTAWNDRIRIMRAIKDLSQEALAEEIGTTRKQVYRWEKGKTKPNAYTRRKLSQWAGVPEQTLFKGIDK